MGIKRLTNQKEREQIKQKKADKAVLLDLQNLLEKLDKRVKQIEKNLKI